MAPQPDEGPAWLFGEDELKKPKKKPKDKPKDEPKDKPPKGGGKKDEKGGKGKKKDKRQEELINAVGDFGWSIAFFKSVPELWKKFNQAIDEGWSPRRFQAEIQNSKWFRKHSDTWRKAYALKKTDPKTYRAQRSEIRAAVSDMAARMGVRLSKDQVNTVAGHAMWMGWSDAEIRNSLSNYFSQTGKSGFDGEAGVAEDELREYAFQMGVRFSDKSLKNWLAQILRGNRTVEAYKNWIQNESVKMFPQLADQIRGGETVAELASPYMQSMAALLEVSPSGIDLFDPTIRKAMSSNDKENPGQMMPLYEFETMLRNDPRWMKTNNARQNINQIGLQVLRDFGFQA